MLPKEIETDVPVAPAPGIYTDVIFEDYLRWPLYNQSVLKEGLRSMAHLRAARDGERVKKVTDDMRLGSALHVAFLEPELLGRKVVEWDGGVRRGKEWEAFRVAHPDRYILTEKQYHDMLGMVAGLRRNKQVREWLGRIESVETAVVGEVNGLRVKARCDAVTADPLVDIKKVADADPRKVLNTVFQFGYDIQGCLYRELFNRERWVLFCVEDESPYDCCAYELTEKILRRAKLNLDALIWQVKECEASGEWPGRSSEIVALDLPEYMEAHSDVTLGGEPLFNGKEDDDAE